jgi:hypothetical protein
MKNLFAQIDMAGSYTNITTEVANRLEFNQHVKELKETGHALSIAETFDHEMKSVGVAVMHYKTCNACLKKELQK